jgi:hypothetical protein
MENHHFFIGKPTINGLSIAMLNYQRVTPSLTEHPHLPTIGATWSRAQRGARTRPRSARRNSAALRLRRSGPGNVSKNPGELEVLMGKP